MRVRCVLASSFAWRSMIATHRRAVIIAPRAAWMLLRQQPVHDVVAADLQQRAAVRGRQPVPPHQLRQRYPKLRAGVGEDFQMQRPEAGRQRGRSALARHIALRTHRRHNLLWSGSG